MPPRIHYGPADERRANALRQQAAQWQLVRPAVRALRKRQPQRELHHAMVEQYAARFEADDHQCAVDLRQNVFREAGDDVENWRAFGDRQSGNSGGYAGMSWMWRHRAGQMATSPPGDEPDVPISNVLPPQVCDPLVQDGQPPATQHDGSIRTGPHAAVVWTTVLETPRTCEAPGRPRPDVRVARRTQQCRTSVRSSSCRSWQPGTLDPRSTVR
jgi:hypothetical protein